MRRATPLLLAGALAGCSTLRERFPSHEDVFTPIPLTLGEPRVQGGDTSYVLAAREYELVARDRALLPDAQQALDQAAARFRRYFGEDAPPVTVHLRRGPRPDARRERAAPDGASRDSARADSVRADSVRGGEAPPDGPRRRVATLVVPNVRQRDGRAPEGPLVLGPLISMAPVARAWLLAATDAVRPPADGGRADGAPASGAPGSGAVAAPRDDPRLPDWWETAAVDILASSSRQDVLVAQLARQPEKLQPLREFFAAARPTAPRDSSDVAAPGARRRGGRGGRDLPPLSGALLFDAQAVAVAQYLAVKEGAPIVGDVTRALAAGRSVEEALRGAREVPREVGGLETTFKAWLATQRRDGRR